MTRELESELAEWSRGRGRLPAGEHRRLVPRWTLVTLTLRHSGDLTADLTRLRRGWDRMRSWLRAELGRVPPFALVIETTPGRDGAGHVHAHACILLPWVAWGRMRAAWARHVGQDDAQVDFSAAARRGTGRLRPDAAARYVAKYVGKPAKTLETDLLSAWLDASYQRRSVTCSRGLLARTVPAPCAECGGACSRERGGGPWHAWTAVLVAQAGPPRLCVEWPTDRIAAEAVRSRTG